MSDLYSMVFGKNPLADILLATLKLTRDDFGRFRDAFISEGQIAVYTRCGGGNREAYQNVFDDMQAHSCFVRDADDDFDSTYCTFFFKFPPEFEDELRKLDRGEKFDPSKRWLDALEKVRSGGRQ